MATETINQRINQSMERAHKKPYVAEASVTKIEDRDWFFYDLTIDPGETSHEAQLRTIMSKKYGSYDEAVIAMNRAMIQALEWYEM